MIPTVIRVRNHAKKSSCFRCSEQALVFGWSLLPMATYPPDTAVALQIRPCLAVSSLFARLRQPQPLLCSFHQLGAAFRIKCEF